MPIEVVTDILGKPLAVRHLSDYKEYNLAFQYSESPTSTHYKLRQVFFLDERVCKVESYFYLD